MDRLTYGIATINGKNRYGSVNYASCKDGKCQAEYMERGFGYCDIGDFGKTVFLTREAAKKALKESEKQ